MVKECTEDGKMTVKWFTFVEKIPFTVESDMRMFCDPVTSSIVINVRPSGGMFAGKHQPLRLLAIS